MHTLKIVVDVFTDEMIQQLGIAAKQNGRVDDWRQRCNKSGHDFIISEAGQCIRGGLFNSSS